MRVASWLDLVPVHQSFLLHGYSPEEGGEAHSFRALREKRMSPIPLVSNWMECHLPPSPDLPPSTPYSRFNTSTNVASAEIGNKMMKERAILLPLPCLVDELLSPPTDVVLRVNLMPHRGDLVHNNLDRFVRASP